MSSMLFGPTDAVEPGVADLGLVTRFGSGVSALSPFEETRDRAGARLGELLVSEGVLSAGELEDALAAQRRTQPRKPLGELLLATGIVSPPLLVRLLAQQCQVQLEEDTSFGTGLRAAIERRHTERTRADEPDLPADEVPAAAPVDAPAPVSPGPRLLGELFVAQGLLTPEQLEWALAEQAESGRLLGEIVVQNGLISMVALVNALVEQLRDGPER
jgi:hypothetical protein